MKKAFQISIAETLFTIEEDAYVKLDSYLASIRKRFAHVEGKDEIVRDIEARIAEKLIEAKKAIVTMAEVESLMASMGSVEDFGEAKEDAKEEEPAPVRTKKLYRDVDNEIIAGVAAGLGAYAGIDAIWVRILFIILVMTSGIGVPLYLILWLAMPPAKTAAQKLEMSGSPVTIETLSESVKERVEEVKKKHVGRFARKADKALKALSKAAWAIANALRVVIGLALALASFAAVFGLSFAAPLAITNINSPYVEAPFIAGLPLALVISAVVATYLAIAIPLAFLFFLSIGIMRKRRPMAQGIAFSLAFVWCVAVIGAGVTGLNVASQYDMYMRESPEAQPSVHAVPLSGPITKLVADDGVRVNVVQGAKASLSVKATKSGFAKLSLSDADGVLEIRRSNKERKVCILCPEGAVEATLIVPSLDAIEARDGSRVSSEVWTSSKGLSILSETGARVSLDANVPSVRAIARYGASISLSGTAASSTAEATYGAEINLRHMKLGSLRADAADGGQVKYSEADAVTKHEESGGDVDRDVDVIY